MISTQSFTAIQYLKIKEDFDDIILEEISFNVTNNISKIRAYFDDKRLVSIIGTNERDSIINHGMIIYSDRNVEKQWDEYNDYNHLVKFLSVTELFFHALWLVKDNSVQNELGHLIYHDKINLSFHSNYLNSAYTTCLGNTELTEFTLEEFRLAIFYFAAVLHTNIVKNQHSNKAIKLANTSRLTKAFYFLQSARTSDDIGTKISLYCSVFESIFSTSTSELRHRLSEAIAFFLEKEYTDRTEIYKAIQLAYDIRSSVVHGSELPSRFLKNDGILLIEIAIKSDDILRRCFTKIILEDELYELFTEKSQEEISKFLQDLIFK